MADDEQTPIERMNETLRLFQALPDRPATPGPIYLTQEQYDRFAAEWTEDTTQWAGRASIPWLTGVPIYVYDSPKPAPLPWWRLVARLRRWWRSRRSQDTAVVMRGSHPNLTIHDELQGWYEGRHDG